MRDIELKPTLVIGIGGSGYQTVLNFKTRLVDAFGRVPDPLALMVFDSAQNNETVRRTSRGEDVSLTQGELVRMTVDNPQTFIRNNPAIKAWFPPRLDSQAIVAGAGMVRARGRLAFFYRFPEIQRALIAAKNRVRLLDNRGRKGAAGEGFTIAAEASDVNVFICSSICGGTGAGAFLDMAWLARDGLSAGSQVNGLLYMPRIFKANVKPSHLIYKNAYSALKELDHWMSGPTPGIVDYGASRLNVTRAPFDLAYLVDGVNRNNQVISDLPQLYQFAAEALFLMVGSQVGQAGESTLDNVVNNLSTRATVNGKKAVYSSFGVGRLRYPARRATMLAVARESVRLGRADLLNGQSNEDQLDADVKSLLLRAGLHDEGGDEFLDSLIRLPEGGIFSPTINLSDVEGDRAAGINALQYGDLRKNAELTSLQRHLDRNYTERLDQARATLNDYFPAALEGRANGISYALNVAHKLQVHLGSWGQRLASEKGDFSDRLERVNVAGALAAVEQAAQRMLTRRRHVEAMIAEFGSTLTTACQLTVEIERRNAAGRLFVTLTDTLKMLTQQFETVRSVCRDVVDDLDHTLENALRDLPDGGFERRIPAHEPDPRELRTSAVEFLARKPGRMIDWTLEDRERIARELQAYVLGHVQRVMTPRLESVVSATQLPALLNELDRVSRPLWQYERAELSPQAAGTETIYIYGVEDAESTQLRQADVIGQLPAGQGKPTFVSTNDPETIYQLQIEAGLPIFALKDLQRWKDDYDDHELPTGHAMEGAKQFAELLPDLGTSEALRVFALAVSDVFKIIHQETKGSLTASEVSYSVTRKRGMREDIVTLGEGRIAAFRAFAADDALVQDVAARVKRQQGTMPLGELVTGLQAYYRALDAKRQQASWRFQVKVHIEQELGSIEEHLEGLGPDAMAV